MYCHYSLEGWEAQNTEFPIHTGKLRLAIAEQPQSLLRQTRAVTFRVGSMGSHCQRDFNGLQILGRKDHYFFIS